MKELSSNMNTEESRSMTRQEWNRYYNEMNGNRYKSYEDYSWPEFCLRLFCGFITKWI